jgi:hypothetical protein
MRLIVGVFDDAMPRTSFDSKLTFFDCPKTIERRREAASQLVIRQAELMNDKYR